MITLNPEKFRQKIAGLKTEEKKDDVNMKIIKLVSLLPMVYSENLERMKMWPRIANGLEASIAKSDGTVVRFYNEVLRFIKAEPGKVAANEEIHEAYTAVKDHVEVLDYTSNNIYTIIVEARRAWKMRQKELK